MFGARQLQAYPQSVQQPKQGGGAREIPENIVGHGFPPPSEYFSRVTLR
jgi:hypothetical protein